MEQKRLRHFKKNVSYDYIMSIKNTPEYLDVECGVGSKVAIFRIHGNSEDNFVVLKKREK